jgi:flagellar motility protein MotE (MotC chaperone)
MDPARVADILTPMDPAQAATYLVRLEGVNPEQANRVYAQIATDNPDFSARLTPMMARFRALLTDPAHNSRSILNLERRQIAFMLQGLTSAEAIEFLSVVSAREAARILVFVAPARVDMLLALMPNRSHAARIERWSGFFLRSRRRNDG